MRLRSIVLASLVLIALPAASMPGFFTKDAPEPKIAPATKATSTCSLWVRYNPDHVVWQEMGWLGDFARCGGGPGGGAGGYLTAANTAAAGLPSWTTYGFDKVSVGDYTPPGPSYACSVNINFEPSTPTKVEVVFTGASTCTDQRDRVLAVVKGSIGCYATGAPCPWSNP